MVLLTAISFCAFAILLANRHRVTWLSFKTLIILLGLFVFWLAVVLFASGADVIQQVFGANGRNTGLITYLALAVVLLTSSISANVGNVRKFYYAGFIVGTSSLTYGLVQAADKDPFNWVNPYSPVLGFLGNPNFQSSLLGILGVLAFSQLMSPSRKTLEKVTLAIYLFVTLFVINETVSQQGFLVLIIGISVVLGISIKSRFASKTSTLYVFGLILGFIAVLTGSLNKGPLSSLLYKDSVTFRGDYWRAGWKMTLENPLFGVGLDNYGEWYRRSRSIEATLRRGPDVTTNAAHNVYLDLSSFGGFPLVLIYAGLMILVVISAWKVIKRTTKFDPHFAGLVGAWFAFQAQSLISINQIGLVIWGWALSGLVIGYEINTRGGEAVVEKKTGKSGAKTVQTSASTTLAVFLGLIIGVAVGMPPYLASAKYKSALETGNPKIIQEAAYLWPLESSRFSQVAATLNDNNLIEEGLKVALDGVEEFPDTYGAWLTLSTMKSATTEQKAQALAQMLRLDPLNPTLK